MYNKSNLGKIKKMDSLAPEVMKAFWAFDKAAVADGAIPVKYKELIAVAVAVTTQCPYCIDIHSGNAPVRRDPPLLSTRLSPSPSQGRAAAETIDVPRHHYIELALGAVLAQRIERRPPIAALSATDAVILVDLRHPPAGPFCRLSQLVLWRGFCVHTPPKTLVT